jgi:hypothetical protein
MPYNAGGFGRVTAIQFDPITANIPIYGYCGIRDTNQQVPWKLFGNTAADIITLYTPSYSGAGNPTPNNVRNGTVYGPDNSAIGTLKIPIAASVAVGVPVDNTVGTAILTQEKLSEVISTIWSQG